MNISAIGCRYLIYLNKAHTTDIYKGRTYSFNFVYVFNRTSINEKWKKWTMPNAPLKKNQNERYLYNNANLFI